MRVPDQIRKCVVFVGREGETDIEYGGTAFIVRVRHEVAGHQIRFPYLVTAGHVAAKLGSGIFWIRANTATGAKDFEADPRTGTAWRFHPDSNVDVAVCPWFIPGPIDGLPIDQEIFATPSLISEWHIGIGDEVFITGLFSKVRGTKQNIPIVRIGNLAMLPGEPVPTKLGDMEAYLIEARSIGGISGSPVFVRRTMEVQQAFHKWGTNEFVDAYVMGPFLFLGLVHGHWEIDPQDINDPNIRRLGDGGRGGVNLGIAIVVPAFKIREAIDHPDLARMRNEIGQQRAEKEGWTHPK